MFALDREQLFASELRMAASSDLICEPAHAEDFAR
jgi:hypothetical protein